jgi:hypothetical protein
VKFFRAAHSAQHLSPRRRGHKLARESTIYFATACETFTVATDGAINSCGTCDEEICTSLLFTQRMPNSGSRGGVRTKSEPCRSDALNAFPTSFGKTSLANKTDTCVYHATVALHLRSNITALCLASGERTVEITWLVHVWTLNQTRTQTTARGASAHARSTRFMRRGAICEEETVGSFIAPIYLLACWSQFTRVARATGSRIESGMTKF